MPYEYNKANYLQTIGQDTGFLAKNSTIRQALGFSLERNPFFLPQNLDHVILATLGHQHTPLAQVPSTEDLRTGDLAVIMSVHDPVYLTRLERAMKIIVYEESLYGQARTNLHSNMDDMLDRVEATTVQRKQTYQRQSLRPVESPTAKKRLTIYDECHTMSNDYTQLQRNVLHLKKMSNVFSKRLKQLDREVRLAARLTSTRR